MKYIGILIGLLLFTNLVTAQGTDPYIGKVKTLDSTIKTLYGVISGEKGEERNWELFNYLFAPEAKLVPSWKGEDGKIYHKYITPAEYQETSGKWLVENGFYEIEISRKVDTFGSVIQVFSTYESFHSKNETEPFMRGINSIQLLNDGERYWVMNIYWRQEADDNPIPEQYLPD
jgi:hypothetical protein